MCSIQFLYIAPNLALFRDNEHLHFHLSVDMTLLGVGNILDNAERVNNNNVHILPFVLPPWNAELHRVFSTYRKIVVAPDLSLHVHAQSIRNINNLIPVDLFFFQLIVDKITQSTALVLLSSLIKRQINEASHAFRLKDDFIPYGIIFKIDSIY